MSIAQGTIEEGIYSIAQEKLKLEQDVTGEEKEASGKKKKDVARLLQVHFLTRAFFSCKMQY